MRQLQAGIIFLIALLPTVGWAQLSGTVESIGFNSYIRPDCWIPMVITVNPQTPKTDFYQIHVKLQDLDRDLPIYTRTISVTGAADGKSLPQRFRMYFMPPPTEGGLPDAADPGALLALQQRLRVSLYTNDSQPKWITDLPLTGALHNIDPKLEWQQRRGAKLVLTVSEGSGRAIYESNADSGLYGVMEDIVMAHVQPRDLPENVIGYDAVDAIVWLDAAPPDAEKFRALEAYIRRGGRLVICQPVEWQKTLGFGDLLPVRIEGVEEKPDLAPLRTMAIPPSGILNDVPDRYRDPFARTPAPYRFARAAAKPDAVVGEKITWPDGTETPYIARTMRGLGSVTWVAQDLGDPSLTRTAHGWVYVWNKVLDLRNVPVPFNNQTPLRVKERYGDGKIVDVGLSLIGGMELSSKSAWLITLAILFFIGYWLLAGPGSFAYLAARRKVHMSWFIFGACALGATALTALIVKVVLRGPPELRHFSVVRAAPDEPAVVTSRIGLYIPRDGPQKIELTDVAEGAVTSISAFPVHPAFLRQVPDQTGSEYTVPVVDVASAEPAHLTFDYRSTLKKFQATWVGEVKETISGNVRLTDLPGFIAGTLTNGTGKRLRNIYVAFNYPIGGLGNEGDWVLYLPSWDAGVTLDLAKVFNFTADGTRLSPGWAEPNRPDGQRPIRGLIVRDWGPFWMTGLDNGPMHETTFDDSANSFKKSLPMLSFYDRLAPGRNEPQKPARVDILRRGGRMLDRSAVISAGGLVVLAEGDGPLPMGMSVEGDQVTGTGTIFYQFALPLGRSELPTTQPSDQ